ncbi:YadA C-terminal domain-containing protein [Dryocola sp. BD626]|uniref:YadA C-terminal domain-containing protein n=1 Tax=Dryocola sp. BD626 TaxID=3133273 RepID=UPI003F503E69
MKKSTIALTILASLGTTTTVKADLSGIDLAAANAYFTQYPDLPKDKVAQILAAKDLDQANYELSDYSYYTGYENGNKTIRPGKIAPVSTPLVTTSMITPQQEAMRHAERFALREVHDVDTVTYSQDLPHNPQNAGVDTQDVAQANPNPSQDSAAPTTPADTAIAALEANYKAAKSELAHQLTNNPNSPTNQLLADKVTTLGQQLAAAKNGGIVNMSTLNSSTPAAVVEREKPVITQSDISKANEPLNNDIDKAQTTADQARSLAITAGAAGAKNTQEINTNKEVIAANKADQNVIDVAQDNATSAVENRVTTNESNLHDVTVHAAEIKNDLAETNQHVGQVANKVDQNETAVTTLTTMSVATAQSVADNEANIATNKIAIAQNTAGIQGAKNDAADAAQSAATAQNSATNAQTSADAAEKDANGAKTAANQAITVANGFSTRIDRAQTTGEYAKSRADTAFATAAANKQALASTNRRVADNSAELANHETRIGALESQTTSSFAKLKNQVDDNRKRSSAGIAGVAAMANIPQVTNTQNFSVGAGVGTADSESALAVGFSARATENTVVKASVSNDTQHNFVAGAGVSYGW